MKKLLLITLTIIGSIVSGQAGRSEVHVYTSNLADAGIFRLGNYPGDSTRGCFTIFVSEGILNIRYPDRQEFEHGEIYIFNLLGQIVARKQLDNSELIQIPLPNRNTCYIIRINYSGRVFTQKIITSFN